MEECCSCHINPPCNYCMSRAECERCGKFQLIEDMIEVQPDHPSKYCRLPITICPSCIKSDDTEVK